MVFDWKNNRDEALRNGIEEKDTVFGSIKILMSASDGEVCDCVFRNFPTLAFEDNIEIDGCTFENCGELLFEDALVKKCTFSQVEAISFIDTKVKKCVFRDMIGKENEVISLQDSSISQCTFENIMLFEDAYLCDGVGTTWIEECTFKNVATTREDLEITNCEETVGKVFKKKKQFCIIDEDSCTGLQQIRIISKADITEMQLPKILIRAVEKGILTQKQADELRDIQPHFE